MPAAKGQLHALGSYEVVRKLGSGGMAEVFLAKQHMAGDVERSVVIKAILPHLAEDERFVRMFLREARIAAHLSHPNIVQIHDVSVIESRPCIVMEFLRGRDLWYVLKTLTDREDEVGAVPAAAVVAQAASALDYAHRRRDDQGRKLELVHRDISPHNLFLTREGQVKVLDFGIAKSRYSQHKTQDGVIRGKLPYMAPEQARNLAIDGRADQFALGVILWEMLTCQRLFAREDPFLTLTELFQKDVRPPSDLVAGSPKELDVIALRALARDPEQRYPSCEAMATELRAWLASVKAPGEAAVVTELLENAAPSIEDEALYGMAFERTATDVPLPPPRPREVATGNVTADRGPLTTPAALASQSSPLRPALIAGGVAAAIVLGIVLALVAGGDDQDEMTVASPPRIVLGGSADRDRAAPAPGVPSTPPPNAPAPVEVEVRFHAVPPDVRLEIDGAAVEGTHWRTQASNEVRHIRALRGTREVWRYDAIFQRTTDVTLPALPPADRVAAGAGGGAGTGKRPPPTKRTGATGRSERLGNEIEIQYP